MKRELNVSFIGAEKSQKGEGREDSKNKSKTDMELRWDWERRMQVSNTGEIQMASSEQNKKFKQCRNSTEKNEGSN